MYKKNRAVAPVIGFILIFAVLSLITGIYFSQIVPSLSEQSEIDTRFTMFEDMSQLNQDIRTASQSDSAVQSTIHTSVSYPPLGFQSGLASYEYLSVDGGVSVDNADESDSEFFEQTTNWDTDTFFIDITHPSTSTVNNEVGYEYGMLYNNVGDGDTTFYAENGGFISGDTIRIQLLDTNLGIGRADSDDVWTVESTEFETTITDDDGSPITITLDTRISESALNEALDKERVSNGGQITDIDYTDQSGDVNEVEIELQQGTEYEFVMSRATIQSF